MYWTKLNNYKIISVFLLILLGCNNKKKESAIVKKDFNISENKITNPKALTIQTFEIDSLLKHFKLEKLPLGNKKLIQTHFPKNKEWHFFKYNSETGGESMFSSIDTVYHYSDFFYNFLKSKKNKYDSLVVVKNKSIYISQNNIINYYDETLEISFFEDLISYKEKYKPLIRLPDSHNHKVLIFSTINSSKDIGKGSYAYRKLQVITANDKGDIIDALDIYLNMNPRYIHIAKLFYVDENYVFHIKDFWNDEEFRKFISYEKWKINEEGKIVRYYEKDGFYVEDLEQGEVKNNVRSGDWIEKKNNGHVRIRKRYNNELYSGSFDKFSLFEDSKTYLESYHLKGSPIDVWSYFKLTQDGEKGKLLYTETYKEGELIERVFIK